jgi:Cu2+-exporting ATPase
VTAGSHNLAAAVLVRVARLGADTRFAEIVAMMEHASMDKPRLALLPTGWRALSGRGAAGGGAGRGLVVAGDPGHALMVAVAVLIVTCPCALSLATPVAMLAAAGRWRARACWCAICRRWRPWPRWTRCCSTRPAR